MGNLREGCKELKVGLQVVMLDSQSIKEGSRLVGCVIYLE